MLAMWEKMQAFVKKKQPEKLKSGRALAPCSDTCLRQFRDVLKGRNKQSSLDRFIYKRPASESAESPSKRFKDDD